MVFKVSGLENKLNSFKLSSPVPCFNPDKQPIHIHMESVFRVVLGVPYIIYYIGDHML